MKKLILVTAITTLAICGSMQKAQEVPIEKAKQVAMSFDNSWSKIVKFFATKNVPVKTIEKVSGLIANDPMMFGAVANKSLFNCGEYKMMGQAQEFQGKANFNVYVEKLMQKTRKLR